MTETTQTSAPKRKSPRWVKVFLVISLAFNLLIIGAVASKVFRPHHRFGGGYKMHHTKPGPSARPGALIKAGRHMMRKMSPERRHEMFQTLNKHRANMQEQMKTLAATRLAFAQHLTNRPDDQAEFEKTYIAVKTAEDALRDKFSEMTNDFIKNLTPAERKLYAKILQDPPRRHWFNRR